MEYEYTGAEKTLLSQPTPCSQGNPQLGAKRQYVSEDTNHESKDQKKDIKVTINQIKNQISKTAKALKSLKIQIKKIQKIQAIQLKETLLNRTKIASRKQAKRMKIQEEKITT